MHIVLYQPEIPPNTGNIIRLCANTGIQLHLIKPLGFSLDEKQCRRAGLDYREWANIQVHDNFELFCQQYLQARIIACSSKVKPLYTDIQYSKDDFLLFGPETRGLPPALLESSIIFQCARIPMKTHSRSINLANAVSIIAYEALRQNGFDFAD